MKKAVLSRSRLLAATAAIALLPGLAMAAAGDARIGAAAAIKGTVTGAVDDQAPQALHNGDAVLTGERLTTGPGASMTVQFADKSTLEIGPNASVIVNPLDIKPVKGGTVKSIMVESGAFRALAGSAAANSQTVIGTHLGAFTSKAAVVLGDVTPQRVALFPADGPGNFTYPSGSLEVPAGGAVVAESDTGNASVVPKIAGDAATTALMGDAMAQLGGAANPTPPATGVATATATPAASQPGTAAPTPPAATAANAGVGYVEAPVGALASAVGPDGYIDTEGATLTKVETTPETEVQVAEQNPPLAPPLPPLPEFAPVPPSPFVPPASSVPPAGPPVPPLPPPIPPASPI